jgi:hypothetical protein
VNFCNATIYYSGCADQGLNARNSGKSISRLFPVVIQIVALITGWNGSQGNHASKNVFIFLERDDRWD